MDKIDVLVVLDRSGSMETGRSDHEGGLNAFMRAQADAGGDVRVTFVQFDSENPCEIVEDRTPAADVKPVKLIPRGGTPLLDAVGKAIAHLDAKITADPAKPDQVIVMIVTDGHENASREWTRAQLRSRIADLEKGIWSFLYLGADASAFADAQTVTMDAAYAANYNQSNAVSIGAFYHATSENILRSRQTFTASASAGASPQAAMRASKRSLGFTKAQRVRMAGGTPTPEDDEGAQSVWGPVTNE